MDAELYSKRMIALIKKATKKVTTVSYILSYIFVAIDTQWVIDLIEQDNICSPEKSIKDIDGSSSESKSNSQKSNSKTHLKNLFGQSKFTHTKSKLGPKQVISSHIKKLDFSKCDENTPQTPSAAPRLVKKSHSDVSYNKETIREVSRKLQDDICKSHSLLKSFYSKR